MRIRCAHIPFIDLSIPLHDKRRFSNTVPTTFDVSNLEDAFILATES